MTLNVRHILARASIVTVSKLIAFSCNDALPSGLSSSSYKEGYTCTVSTKLTVYYDEQGYDYKTIIPVK